MRAMSKIVFCLFIGLNCSCWNLHSVEPKPSSTALIYYRNAQGQNLLDPNTLGHFDQGIITISWLNTDGSKGTDYPIIFNYIYNTSIPYLPGGYCVQINPYSIKDNKGNNGIAFNNVANILINLNPSITDTLFFQYSSAGLQKLAYNKTSISPPQNKSSFPAGVPVIINK
jgi:hypothetical protein